MNSQTNHELPMRLSAIMPVYNHADLLPRAVNALVTQSVPPDELILVDDGSTDNTDSVARNLAKSNAAIKLISLSSNQGASEAVSHARQIAKGKYIYFAAADDYVAPDFIQETTKLLDQNPDIAFCSALACNEDKADHIFTNDTPIYTNTPVIIKPDIAAKMICAHGTWFPKNTAVYRRSALDELGEFESELGPFSDGFFCMALALKYGCGYIPKIFCYVNYSSSSTTSRVAENIQERMRIHKLATEKMSGTYAEIFEPYVVRAWTAHWIFSAIRQITDGPRNTWSMQLRKLMPHLGRVDIAIIVFSGLIHTKVARAFALFRLSPIIFFRRIVSIAWN